MNKLSHAAKTAKDFAVMFIKDIKKNGGIKNILHAAKNFFLSVAEHIKYHKIRTIVLFVLFMYFFGFPLLILASLSETLRRPNEKQTEFFENYYGFSLAGKEYISKVTIHGWQDSGVWVYVENITDYENFMNRTDGEYEFHGSYGGSYEYHNDYGLWQFTEKKNGQYSGFLSTKKQDEEFSAFYHENFFWGRLNG